jgi:hypothetical protein
MLKTNAGYKKQEIYAGQQIFSQSMLSVSFCQSKMKLGLELAFMVKQVSLLT